MQAKIGLILVGRKEYNFSKGKDQADRLAMNLRQKGVEVFYQEEIAFDPVGARKLAIDLLKKDISGFIIFITTWIECDIAMAAIREVEHLPFAIWSFPMWMEGRTRQQTGSFPAYAVLKGTLDRMGYRFAPIYGNGDDPEAINKAIDFIVATDIKKRLKRTRIGLIGYASMMMYTGTFDHLFLRKIIGPEIVHIDNYTFINEAKKVRPSNYQKVIEDLRRKAKIADEVTPQQLIKVSRMYIALKSLCNKSQLEAINVKCQYELSREYGMVACIPLSLLADNGIVTGCEGDIITMVTMLILHYLTNQTIYYGDVLDIKNNKIFLSSCGFVPYSLAERKEEIKICNIGHPGFRGLINSFNPKVGKITFARLVEEKGNFHLNYGVGTAHKCELRQGRFPAMEFEIEGQIDFFLKNMESQHYAICYGNVTKRIESLCHLLGIEERRI